MDGLLVKYIPQRLLGRILLQLNILPQHLLSHIDILSLITEGYELYGNGSDLDGLFTYCQQKTLEGIKEKIKINSENKYNAKRITWFWYDLILFQFSDWGLLNQEQYNHVDIIGLRLQITSELARPGIDLVRSRKKNSFSSDKKLVYHSEGRRIPINNILKGTITYISNHSQLKSDHSNNKLISIINQRLNQLEIDTEKNQPSQKENEIEYTLSGVLMVKYNASINGGMMDDAWCLYLRDYVDDSYGSKWRIISGTGEQYTKISSKQALSDIRGRPFEDKRPSSFSTEYKPVYLFYCNNDRINRSITEDTIPDEIKVDTIPNNLVQNTIKQSPLPAPNFINNDIGFTYPSDIRMTGSSDIRMADSSDIHMTDSSDIHITASSSPPSSSSTPFKFHQQQQYQQNSNDNDSTTSYLEEMLDFNDLENEVCKHCGISDSIDNVNTIFFCDLCDLGVHQLCEDPPISTYETDIDPWYCRSCSKIIKSTLPQDNTPRSLDEGHDNDESVTKRQRIE